MACSGHTVYVHVLMFAEQKFCKILSNALSQKIMQNFNFAVQEGQNGNYSTHSV